MKKNEAENIRDVYGSTGKLLPPLEGAPPPASVFRVQVENGKIYYAYEYPHPSVAATVVLLDVERNAFLLIKRLNEPYKDYYAFPGGFLDVGEESIEETAARELFEEAGVEIDPSKLGLIDVRSDPQRDPRDHVFDIAYYAESERVAAIAGDEVSAYKWASDEELNTMTLAFDHDELWSNVKAKFRA